MPTSNQTPLPTGDGGAKRREEMAARLERGDLSFLEFEMPLPAASPTRTAAQNLARTSCPNVTLVVGR